MDLHTRRLRYFVAVADELHFSRAADRLFVSQQTLSKQINELEHEIGVQLFRRSTRRVELTPAGAALRESFRVALEQLDEAIRDAQQLTQGQRGNLTLGFFVLAALELTTPILNRHRALYPDVDVTMHEFHYQDPSAGLAAGTSDLAIVRLPVRVTDLQVEPLFSEPRVAAVCATHPLAARSAVSVQELRGERLTSAVTGDAEFRHFWGLADFLPQPAQAPIATTSHAEELEIVATGQACSITAACAARFAPHTGVRFVEIVDVPRVVTALAWRSTNHSPLAARFVDVARAVRDESQDLVRAIERPTLSPS